MKFKTIVLTILFVNQFLNAQNIVHKDLFSLYQDEKFEALKSKLTEIDKTKDKSAEIVFLNTLYMENGEEAVKIYLELFEKSFGELKSVISKKLSDYYYAKGYYLTASKYQKYLVETASAKSAHKKNISPLQESNKYIIQLGAFGQKENATQLQEMLQTQNLYTRIEDRTINGNILHCVWLDGKEGFSETLKFAEKIKEKYHLQYRILQQ